MYIDREDFAARNKVHSREQMECVQRATSAGYTLGLALSRQAPISLAGLLVRELGEIIVPDSSILELGPGSEAFLYYLVHSLSEKAGLWQGLEIKHEFVESLQAKKMPNFMPLEGSANDLHSAILANSIDAVIGLCSFDSMMDFDGIAQNSKQYLKPGGHVVLIQDLYPSDRTIMHLIMGDSRFDQPFSVLGPYGHLNYILHNPDAPGEKIYIDTREYLQRRISEIFGPYGFHTVRHEKIDLGAAEMEKSIGKLKFNYFLTIMQCNENSG